MKFARNKRKVEACSTVGGSGSVSHEAAFAVRLHLNQAARPLQLFFSNLIFVFHACVRSQPSAPFLLPRLWQHKKKDG